MDWGMCAFTGKAQIILLYVPKTLQMLLMSWEKWRKAPKVVCVCARAVLFPAKLIALIKDITFPYKPFLLCMCRSPQLQYGSCWDADDLLRRWMMD